MSDKARRGRGNFVYMGLNFGAIFFGPDRGLNPRRNSIRAQFLFTLLFGDGIVECNFLHSTTSSWRLSVPTVQASDPSNSFFGVRGMLRSVESLMGSNDPSFFLAHYTELFGKVNWGFSCFEL